MGPPGTAKAFAVDESGARREAAVGAECAWVVSGRDRTVGVRFEDAAGEVLRGAELSPEPRRLVPAPGATAPCVACGAVSRELASFPPRYPEEGDEVEPESVVCRRCGHEVELGLLLSAEVDEEAERRWRERSVAAARQAFAAAGFAGYGVEDAPADEAAAERSHAAWAVASEAEEMVSIVARGMAPEDVALAPVIDVEPHLAAPAA